MNDPSHIKHLVEVAFHQEHLICVDCKTGKLHDYANAQFIYQLAFRFGKFVLEIVCPKFSPKLL
jgi:hypothetical protein